MNCPKCQSLVVLNEEFGFFICDVCDGTSAIESGPTVFQTEVLGYWETPKYDYLKQLALDYKNTIQTIPINELPRFKNEFVKRTRELGFSVKEFWDALS